ncbi:MAG: nucleotidyltransferase [Deferrisomatales bacterium]|nr:nucleotidyltransferase [Deferrisomatales bacterium]
MLTEAQQQFGLILESLSDALDVPPSRYEEAEEHYKAVTDWLGAEGSALAPYDPDLYPQGSFRLGTAIKPVTEHDEYDVDLVCQLALGRDEVEPKDLKRMVGERLRASEVYKRMLREGKRCWTLDYADGAKFHLDILPAIPDLDGAPESILITDAALRDWQHSNPRGYGEWFKARMEVVFLEKRAALAESLRASVEEIPDYKVRTPLQRAVQILRRHRDIAFEKDPDGKPASIIITTLAAWAYGNEADLYEALTDIAARMAGHLEDREGVAWLPNPVNPKENFCDRWRDHPERHLKFLRWVRQVGRDLEATLAAREEGLPEVAKGLERLFGARPVNEAFERFGDQLHETRKAGSLRMASRTGTLGVTGATTVLAHSFFGGDEEEAP